MQQDDSASLYTLGCNDRTLLDIGVFRGPCPSSYLQLPLPRVRPFLILPPSGAYIATVLTKRHMPYRLLLLAQGGGSSGRKDGSNHHKIILVTKGLTPSNAGEHNAY
jgi:hypothetical protein